MARVAQDAQQQGAQLAEDDWDAPLAVSNHEHGEPAAATMPFPESIIPRVGGGEVRVKYEPSNFMVRYLDEYNRAVLQLDRNTPAKIQ